MQAHSRESCTEVAKDDTVSRQARITGGAARSCLPAMQLTGLVPSEQHGEAQPAGLGPQSCITLLTAQLQQSAWGWLAFQPPQGQQLRL